MRRHWWIDYLCSTVTVSRKPYQWHKCGSLGVDDPDFLVSRLSQQAIAELEEASTTGFRFFFGCLRYSVKALPSAVLGKKHTIKN